MGTTTIQHGGYELRFCSLLDASRGYSFPCDARGNVDMDALSDREHGLLRPYWEQMIAEARARADLKPE